MKKFNFKKWKKKDWSKVFSTLICLTFGAYGIWCGWKYYSLCQLAIENQTGVMPDATLAITCVTVVIGSLISYLTYNGYLKGSRNKHHVDANGVPYDYNNQVPLGNESDTSNNYNGPVG